MPDVSDNSVQKVRSWTGLVAVIVGNVAIAIAAILAIYTGALTGDNASTSPIVAILTSAFTAIGTLTTAYFGIRAVANANPPAPASQK